MEMMELHQTVGRIEAKVDVLLIDRRRLDAVEKRQWISIGGLGVALALLMPKIREVFEFIPMALGAVLH